MKHPAHWPAALARRWFLLIGFTLSVLLIGVILYIALLDRILLYLSIALFLLSVLRCLFFYHTIAAGHYQAITGVCIALKGRLLHRRRAVHLLTESGAEQTLYLDQGIRLQIGNCYRFYFGCAASSASLSESSGFFLSTGQFLGFENLGEYQIKKDSALQDEPVKK